MLSKFKQFADSRSVLLLAGIIALAMMYHHIIPLNGILFIEGAEGQDWGQMVWNLWFVNEAITGGHNPLQTGLLYYPLGANLAHHTLAAGFFPVTFLTKLFSRGDPLYPVYAYHLITWLCFLLLLACSYLLLRELSFTRLASATAASAYAFSDYYQQHTVHLNLIAGFFFPLTALFLVRAYKKPNARNLIYAAMVAASAVYFTEYALYIYLGVFLFLVLMFCFPEERRRLADGWRALGWKPLLISLGVFVLIVTPFLANYLRDRVIKPPLAEVSLYSANLAAFFVPSGNHALLAKVFSPLNARITSGVAGYEVFLGFTLIAFALVGILTARKRLMLCAAICALVFYVLSLGPTLKVFSSDTGVRLPYALLMQVPPFTEGRTPVRFVSIATFFLMIIAAGGLSWLYYAIRTKWSLRSALGVLTILFVLTLAGAYSPISRRHAFTPPEKLKAPVAGPVFNVPLQGIDGYASLLQVFHHQPIATGYVARQSPQAWQRFRELKLVYDQGGSQFCQRVAAMGFQNIIITAGEVVAPLELSRCSIRVIDLRTDPAWTRSFPGGSKSDEPRFPVYTFGTRLNFGIAGGASHGPANEDYLWYGWSGREPISRWTERGVTTITFGLAKVEPATLRLRLAPFLAPGKLESQRLNVHLNGQPVASLTLTNRSPEDIEIALPAEALRKENVLAFHLPDAASPDSLNVSGDMRLLGINVHWLEIVPKQGPR
ncbi:MAG: hypothetical protein ABI596_06695 [Pyrinomonadaceae bacterium]